VLPLARLNARLPPWGYVIRASKGRDAKQMVRGTAENGQVDRFGLFELRPITAQSSARMTTMI
jgi:hypothetical protein